MNINEDLYIFFIDSDVALAPSFFQGSCTGTRPVFREITDEELAVHEESLTTNINEWTRDLSLLPPVSHKKLYDYMVEGTISIDNKSRGAIKHEILGYQLFKENFVKSKTNGDGYNASVCC